MLSRLHNLVSLSHRLLIVCGAKEITSLIPTRNWQWSFAGLKPVVHVLCVANEVVKAFGRILPAHNLLVVSCYENIPIYLKESLISD